MNETGVPLKLRNARACEACRASKSKCTFRPQQTICQRCEVSNGRCIVRTKARPMRTRHIQTQVTTDTSQTPIFPPDFALNLPSVTAPDIKQGVKELHARHQDFFDETVNTSAKKTIASSPINKKRLEQRQITLLDAQNLLAIFKAKATFFPFVDVRQDMTVPQMSRENPFLLLAVLTSAAIGDLRLYHQIDHEFKRVLSNKIIVEGKKSLDFLQGLLVYIAWYPVHTNPKNNQSFMYMNLAISLVTDLGLDREIPNPTAFSDFDLSGLYTPEDTYTTTAKQAYLGTYYLSSALSLGFQKPNNFQYRNLMDSHGVSLMQSIHQTSRLDGLSPSRSAPSFWALTQLKHMKERISRVNAGKAPATDARMDAINAEMNIQIFLNELEDWRFETSEDVRNLPNVKMAELFCHICIYSYGLGFLRKPYSFAKALSDPIMPISPTHLMKCLDSLKKFFEYLLSLPEDSYLAFTTVEWGVVVNAIVVMSRLTFMMANSMGWDSYTTRQNIPLVMYLDCLCWRFGALSKSGAENDKIPADPDILWVFKMMVGSVKKSYEKRVAAIEPGCFTVSPTGNLPGPPRSSRSYCPVLDPTLKPAFASLHEDYLDTSLDNFDNLTPYDSSVYSGASMFDTSVCVEGTTVGYRDEMRGMDGGGDMGGFAGQAACHNVWATMTSNWAEEF